MRRQKHDAVHGGHRDLRADIVAERRRFADTLAEVGPAAPSLAGAWTAEDVAAHVVSLDRLGGVPTFLGRTAVSRGHRLNDATGRLAEGGIRSTRRRGFAWVLDRLRAAPPRLLMRDGVAPVGLFEVFVHHEDVRRASGRWSPRATPEGLACALPWLLRYQRRILPAAVLEVHADDVRLATGTGPTVVLSGPTPDVVLWLAGRRDVADVQLRGDDTVVEQLRACPLRV